MGVGENIRIFRLLNNMTQEELAEKMGYKSKASINKIEKEVKNLPIEKLQKIADILHTSPLVLLGEESSVQYVLSQQMERYSIQQESQTLKDLHAIEDQLNEDGLKKLLDYAEDIKDKYRKDKDDAKEEKEI